MKEALFDIVFKGKFVRQIDQAKAILHFSKLFKMSVEKAQKFFDGNPRTLKKNLDLEKASKFRASLKKAGLRVSMVKQVTELEESHATAITMEEVGAIIVNKPFVQPKHFDTSQFSVDEVGVEIIHPEPVEPVEFDFSDLEIDEVGAKIIEKSFIPEPEFDVADITIEEVGATFAEKPDIPEPDLDISDIEMEEVGATIAEKKAIPEPEFNIDNIELTDE